MYGSFTYVWLFFVLNYIGKTITYIECLVRMGFLPRYTPVMASVTGCSTWRLLYIVGFIGDVPTNAGRFLVGEKKHIPFPQTNSISELTALDGF